MYYKDDSCWSANLKSKATEDIISIRSFMEVFVLNQYVLLRKILSDQGKEKKRPSKDTQPSKKSSASSESSKVKTPPKTSKYGKSVTAEEPHEKHVHEISMDAEENIVDEMSNADEQPYGDDAPKIDNGPKNNWFKQPPRPPTPDPEWNTCLILDKITKADLVGPVYKLLKGPYQSSIELEYNLEECYKALSDRLDWTNPEGDRCPYDSSKHLPLKSRPGHLTVPAEHFFNNDLEYLKSKNLENNVVKVGYNKDDERGISHWAPKRQLFYKSQSKKLSKHNVYSTLKILSVTVDKQFGYGYLEEIVNIRVILHSIHSDDGNPTIANIKQALRQVFPTVTASSP
ncbi:hypothetical protein Tco_1393290 [Tanacetum coccineum]